MADRGRGLVLNPGPGRGKTTAAMGTALRAVADARIPERLVALGRARAAPGFARQVREMKQMGLDEINASSYGMLDPAKVLPALRAKPEKVHVILTGPNAHPTMVDTADTVREMRQANDAYGEGRDGAERDRVLSTAHRVTRPEMTPNSGPGTRHSHGLV